MQIDYVTLLFTGSFTTASGKAGTLISSHDIDCSKLERNGCLGMLSDAHSKTSGRCWAVFRSAFTENQDQHSLIPCKSDYIHQGDTASVYTHGTSEQLLGDVSGMLTLPRVIITPHVCRLDCRSAVWSQGHACHTPEELRNLFQASLTGLRPIKLGCSFLCLVGPLFGKPPSRRPTIFKRGDLTRCANCQRGYTMS
jgi:hypothetical protein